MDYVTLTQVRAYRNLKTGETADDVKLQGFIRGASRFVDTYCGRRFDARRETRLLDYPLQVRSAFGVYDASSWVTMMNAAGDLGAGVLRLDDDLLSVETLLNGDGAAIAPDAYVLEPANASVHHTIRLLSNAGLAWLPGAGGRREQVISITGLWGSHPNYPGDAWIDSGDTVANDPSLSASSTALTVANASGAAADLQQPRLQAGQLLQIGSEFASVQAVNYTTNVVTIKRAANGTVAALHAKGAAIAIYRPPESIVMAVLRLVAWRYTQKDANSFDREAILGTGIAITPSAVPPDVLALLPAPKPLRLT
jgi:hypothetical protein